MSDVSIVNNILKYNKNVIVLGLKKREKKISLDFMQFSDPNSGSGSLKRA